MGYVSLMGTEHLRASGCIREGDVRRLRGVLWQSRHLTLQDADALLAIDRACPVQDPSWSELLVEVVTELLVMQATPRGYLNADNANWLVGRIVKGGRIESRAHLELLIHVLDRARWAPPSLSALALSQVGRAVIDGSGPGRSAAPGEAAGRVTAGDAELLRRILCAFGGDDGVAISRPEVEVLFGIDAATREADNDPAWSGLYVKAIANAVLAASGYAVPSREVALARQTRPDAPGELGPDALARHSVRGGNSGVPSAYRVLTGEERVLARLERQRMAIVTAEAVGEDEAQWLAERIERDVDLSRNERLLLRFLEATASSLHPRLCALIGRASSIAA